MSNVCWVWNRLLHSQPLRPQVTFSHGRPPKGHAVKYAWHRGRNTSSCYPFFNLDTQPEQQGDPMLHEPASPSGKDPASAYKTRLGIWMVTFYSLFYAGFVAINLLNPLAMGMIVWMGLNLATVYGAALIIVALIEALIYNALCHKKEDEFARAELLNNNPASLTKEAKG